MGLNPLIVGLATCLLFGSVTAEAQPAAKVPRVGVVSPIAPGSPTVVAFRQALRELGYIEGKNVVV